MASLNKNVLFSVGMNTQPFQKGAQDVEAVRKQMANNLAKYKSQEIQGINQISVAKESLIEAQKRLDIMTANGVATSSKEYKAQEREIVKLSKEIDKYGKQVYKVQQLQQENINTTNEILKKQGNAWAGIKKSLSGFGGLVAGAVSVGALVQVVDKLDKIGKRAKDLGITASQLQEMSYRADLAGISSEKLDVALKTLAKTAQKDVKSEFLDLADKAEKGLLTNAEAAKKFGENGVEMVRILSQGREAVEKIFEANGIDKAVDAAERFKDQLANIQNVGFKVGASVVEGWSSIADFITNDIFKGIGDAEYQRAQKRLNDLAVHQDNLYKQRIEAEAKENKKRLDELDKIDAEDKKRRERELSDFDKVINLKNKISILDKEIEQYDESSVEYGKIYKDIIESTFELEKAQERLRKADVETRAQRTKDAESELKRLDSEKNKQQDIIKKEQEKLALQRKEYDEKLKIDILTAQGKTKEVEKIRLQKEYNDLLKMGFSTTEARIRLEAQENAKQKGVYSEKDVAKAQKILDRAKSGKGGTVGKKTLAEAQAIVEGKPIEGGAETTLFKSAKMSTPKVSLKGIESTESTKQTLSAGEQLASQSANELKKIDSTMNDIKRLIQGIATKKGAT